MVPGLEDEGLVFTSVEKSNCMESLKCNLMKHALIDKYNVYKKCNIVTHAMINIH